MKRILLALLMVTFMAHGYPGCSVAKAETLSWNAVTTYTDGSTISRPVTYSVYDNVYHATNPIAAGVVGTSWPIANAGSGVVHRYEVTATVDGTSSARSAGLNWTSPFKVPDLPAGLRVQ